MSFWLVGREASGRREWLRGRAAAELVSASDMRRRSAVDREGRLVPLAPLQHDRLSVNGRELARLLEKLVAAWPVRVR